MKERIDIQNKASANAPQNITAVTPEHIENQKVARGAPIRILFGGLAGGYDFNRARKAHVREVRAVPRALQTNLVGKPPKEAKIKHNTITFTEEEARGIH